MCFKTRLVGYLWKGWALTTQNVILVVTWSRDEELTFVKTGVPCKMFQTSVKTNNLTPLFSPTMIVNQFSDPMTIRKTSHVLSRGKVLFLHRSGLIVITTPTFRYSISGRITGLRLVQIDSKKSRFEVETEYFWSFCVIISSIIELLRWRNSNWIKESFTDGPFWVETVLLNDKRVGPWIVTSETKGQRHPHPSRMVVILG